jgi:hypothetical protein
MAALLSNTSGFSPIWATKPMPSSGDPARPPFGTPRRTRSLCPRCNVAATDAVLRGEATMSDFRDEPGIIDAEVLEASGRIAMRKTCARHGSFEDTLSTNPAFFKRMESLYFRRDMPRVDEESLRAFEWASPRTGRGAALIVDLTNRCNLKCWPCFMDANQVPYVHELSMNDIRRILDRARAVKPQRDINILFSGANRPSLIASLTQCVTPRVSASTACALSRTASGSLRSRSSLPRAARPVCTRSICNWTGHQLDSTGIAARPTCST